MAKRTISGVEQSHKRAKSDHSGAEINIKLENASLADKAPQAMEKSESKNTFARSISACQRCRSKKIKCDQRLPKCTKCERNGTECVSLDPVTRREVPRSYVVHLEERVRELEAQLQPAQHNNTPSAHSVPNTATAPTTATTSPLQDDTDGQTIAFSKLITTAVKVTRKSTSHEPGELRAPLPPEFLPAILPPKITALKFAHIFFAQSNSQLPVLHRNEFVNKYFVPVYGEYDHSVSLASDYTMESSIPVQPDGVPWFDQYKEHFQAALGPRVVTASNDEIKRISNTISPPKHVHKCLFFLNMVFAIASSVHHLQYPATISESFRVAAYKHLDDAKTSGDPLEALQAVLLQSLYATMRPTNPTVWYFLGTALRMCVDLELHNESNTTVTANMDLYQKDRRRRLFWCTYSIDRQISFYLDRPVGIPDESINTPFPSDLDDSLIVPGSFTRPVHTTASYKTISLSMFRIRQVQSEVQRVLYTNAEIPREYATLDDWKLTILGKLTRWKEKTPQTPQQMNCNFNLQFFNLNYHHTMLMLHNLSPKNFKLSVNDVLQVSHAAKELINCYTELFHTKSINYTWAAVHNLFMAGTSFLYTVYNSSMVRAQNPLETIKSITSDCLNVLSSLSDRCEPASYCFEVFQSLTMAIIKLKYNEVFQGFSVLQVTKDNLNHVHNNNVKSNVSRLVENLRKDQSNADDNLNPFMGADPHFDDYPSSGQLPDSTRQTNSPTPTFEWLSERMPSEKELSKPLQFQDAFDLDEFFQELETGSVKSIPSRANSVLQNSPDQDRLVANSGQHSNGNSPNPNGNREGKRTFELMHQTPNDLILDQFFASNPDFREDFR